MPGLEFASGRYVIRFEPREVADILALDGGRQDESAFEVVKRVAQVNQSMYDTFVSPLVRAMSNESTAALSRNLTPARLERHLFSDNNPLLKAMAPLAEMVKAQRKQVAPDNPLLLAEQQASKHIGQALDHYRDVRDAAGEMLFKAIYESPLLKAMVGINPSAPPAGRPGAHSHGVEERRHLKRVARDARYEQGSQESGFLRLLIYVASGVGVVDKRPFDGIRALMRERGLDKTITLTQLKEAVNLQTYLVRQDEARALQGLRVLLPEPAQRSEALALAHRLLEMGGPIKEEKLVRLRRIGQILEVDLPEKKV
jgi:hypothetical protein